MAAMAAVDRVRDQVHVSERAYFMADLGLDCQPTSTCGEEYRYQTGRPLVCDDVILNDQPSGPGMKNELWMVPDYVLRGSSP